jgi:uncharacterized protein YkvS
MNNVQTAITAIRSMNNDELNQVVEALKLQRTWLARSTARSLSVGDTVEFKGRAGVQQGRVTKVNPKNIIVDCGYTRYKVPASMLSLVEA